MNFIYSEVSSFSLYIIYSDLKENKFNYEPLHMNKILYSLAIETFQIVKNLKSFYNKSNFIAFNKVRFTLKHKPTLKQLHF